MSYLIRLNGVSKGFGGQDVFSGLQWQLEDRTRTALVGRNGAGKTTLFKLITGVLEPDTGRVHRRSGVAVEVLEQDVLTDDGRTLRDEAERGIAHIKEMEAEFAAVTQALGSMKEGDPEAEDLLGRYAYLEERLQREGAYATGARIDAVLGGLHFSESDLDRPLAEFSGGQKNRAALARVLLRDPDLLLLDEPTNYLDLDAIEWLESFLDSYRGAYILVSHDRVFVNRLARETVELRGGKLQFYTGNYDAFLVERERRLEEQYTRYEQQQEEIRRMETFIQKNIARASTSNRAKSRRNKLERMERLEAPEWPASSIRMELPEPSRSARNVVDAKNLAKEYGAVKVFRNLTFLVQRGQKVGLVGPNGVGKTTLLKILAGEEGPTDGRLRIGPAVEIGYYEQEHTTLRGSQSLLDEVWSVTPQVTESEMRTFLGSFLFRGEAVFKALHQLSGGERSRVALAKLVRGGANFILMDEPTNHLDLESRAVIEAVLAAYQGTLLVSSHDRALLQGVVDHVIEIHADGSRTWEGYDNYVAERKRRGGPAVEAKPEAGSAPAKAPPAGKPSLAPVSGGEAKEGRAVYEEAKRRRREEGQLRKRVAGAEEKIRELEDQRESLQLAMSAPEVSTDSARLHEMTRELRALEESLSGALREWEAASIRLEAIQDALGEAN